MVSAFAVHFLMQNSFPAGGRTISRVHIVDMTYGTKHHPVINKLIIDIQELNYWYVAIHELVGLHAVCTVPSNNIQT